MKRLAKYWAILRTQVVNQMTYWGDLIVQSFTILLFLWIFLQLWRTTYGASGQTQIAGLTLNDTLWYLMIAETQVLSRPRISRTVSDAVKDGSIAYLLNKPYSFLLYQLSVSLGDISVRMVFNILAGGTLVWITVGPPPDLRTIPLTLVALLLGWLIDFSFAALIGLTAFITEDVAAFEWIYQKVVFLLGGLLIPLDFFPPWLRSISLVLPFAYTLYGPARIFVDPSMTLFGRIFIGQIIWLGVVSTILVLFYQRSINRLAINGG